MNFETLKTGFRRFLVENAKPWEKSKLQEKDNDDISIFTYADEFKSYLNSELNCDESILYQDISDILNMQFVDGQLVDPDEAVEDDPSLKAEVEEGQSLQEQQVIAQKPVEESESSETGAQDAPSAPSEGAEAAPLPPSGETESAASADGEVEAVAPDDAQNMQNPEGDAVSAEGIENYANENEVKLENSEVLAGILNDLLKNDDFKAALDSTLDGQIDEEELRAFLEAIKSYDEDENTISLKDILAAIENIKNGELVFVGEAGEKIDSEPQTEQVQPQSATQTNSPSNSGGCTGSGGVSGVGGYGGTSGASKVEQKPKYDENGNAILENMDLDDLKKELADSKSKVAEREKAVTTAKTEKEEGLGKLEQEAQDAYDDFAEKMDEESREKLDVSKGKVDEKQEALDNLEEQIDSQKEAVTSAQENYDSADASLKNLESSKTAYEAQKEALKTSISKAKDGSKSASEMQSKLSAIENKISAVEAEIEAAKQKRDEAKAKLDEAQNAKDELEAQKPGFEEELKLAQDDFSIIEDEIVGKNPALEEFRDKYDQTREKIQTEKANYDKNIEKAQTELKAAQDHVREVEAAINAAETSKDIKDNYSSGSNEEIIEFAKQFLGCNEADGSANVFLGGSSASSTPWCAAFVSYILKNNGIDTGGTWAVSGLLEWGKQNGTFVPKSDSNSGTVKAGDVVIWKQNGRSHTGIVTSISPDGTYTTIEGNTSNRVGERSYNINSDAGLTGFISINA